MGSGRGRAGKRLLPPPGVASESSIALPSWGSFIINIGNWIFFASYLKLEGEMYCPPSIGSVLALWFCVPLGVDLLFFAYRVWTQDVGYSDQSGLGVDVMPATRWKSWQTKGLFFSPSIWDHQIQTPAFPSSLTSSVSWSSEKVNRLPTNDCSPGVVVREAPVC